MIMKKQSLNNVRFGNLLVLDTEWVSGRRFCKCACDCGNEKTIAASSLMNGDTKSCGCLRSSMMKAKQTKHGAYGSLAYRSYRAMLARCTDNKHPEFSHYGGRGILICDRWKSGFAAFLADMGERPQGTTLDRIDVDGMYEPSNCRWATIADQANGKRNVRVIEHNGLSHTITEWSKILGIPRDRISCRLKRGKSIEESLRA